MWRVPHLQRVPSQELCVCLYDIIYPTTVFSEKKKKKRKKKQNLGLSISIDLREINIIETYEKKE